MGKKRKPSVNRVQFENEIKRITKLVKKLEKSGLMFIESPIPEMPKRVTKQRLEKVKLIKTKTLKEKAYVQNKKTGKVEKYVPKSGKRSGRLNVNTPTPTNRSASARRGWETRRRRAQERAEREAEREAEQEAEQNDIPEENEPNLPGEENDYDLPPDGEDETDYFIATLYDELATGWNANIAGLLESILSEEFNTNEEELRQRLMRAGENAVEFCRASIQGSTQEGITQPASRFIELITGRAVDPFISAQLNDLSSLDIDNRFS